MMVHPNGERHYYDEWNMCDICSDRYYGKVKVTSTPSYAQEQLNYLAELANEPLKGSALFHDILRSLGELHDRKQADYGSTGDPFRNVRNSEDFGIPAWVGAIVRANDKMRRLQTASEQVLAGQDVSLKNESIIDSFRDLAVYAIIAEVLYREANDDVLV
jgi:hypothetical protein